jgi:LysM repeat protein
VRRGECLESIARRYKLSVGHLKRINGLKSNRLYVGARLRIKSRSYQPSKTVRYIVKRGDNLTFIANKFKTTVKRVRALNKLRKNTLAIGQVLRLEAANLN